MMSQISGTQISGTQKTAFFIAVGVHVAVLGWASQYSPRANPLRPPEPVMVSLLASAPLAARDVPSASKPPLKNPAPAAPDEHALAPHDPSPNTASAATTAPATEAAPAGLPQVEALTLARFDAAYLRNPALAYPLLSRRLGEQGKVLLRVLVHTDGSAMSVEIETGSGYTRLDQAARETVMQWRFIPAMQGDKTVNSWVIVPINFSLKG